VELEPAFRRVRPAVRASDADRERTVEILKRNAAAGRLDDEELSTRLDGAFAAKTLGDLQPLIADLPEGNRDPVADLVGGVVRGGMQVARVGLWVALGGMTVAVILPVAIILAATVSPAAGLIAAAALVLLILLGVGRARRRRSRRAQQNLLR